MTAESVAGLLFWPETRRLYAPLVVLIYCRLWALAVDPDLKRI